MAQMPDGKSKGNDRVTFTRAAADRIAAVVLEVEGGERHNGALEFGYRGSPAAKTFRVCTFTGAWAVGASKVVTFKNQTATPNTVSAVNVFLGMSPTGASDCCVAKEGTGWHCVSANLAHQPGYSASGTQVLTIQNGNIRWVGTTACT